MNPHYNVVAAVLEQDGKIFCGRRGETKFPYTSNKYEFPGGKIEPGETEEEALKREIREELQMEISIKYLLLRTSYNYPDFSVSIAFFLCTMEKNAKAILMEHNDSVWASPDEMRKLDWVAADKMIVEEWESINISSRNRGVVCLNCGKKFNSLFCPDCGQRKSIKRFDWKEVLRSITRGFFNADRGIFYTIKQLFIRPGKLSLNYLEGKRIRCFPPFPMIFIFAAAYGMINGLRKAIYPVEKIVNEVGTKKALEEIGKARSELPATDSLSVNILDLAEKSVSSNGKNFLLLDDFPLIRYVYERVTDNIGLVVLLAMPFFVVAARRCFGRGFRKLVNWPESYIVCAFYYAQCFMIFTLLALVSLFFRDADWKGNLMVLSSLGVLVWYLVDCTPSFGWRKKIWRSLLTYLYFFFLLIIGVVILVIILVCIVAISHHNLSF